MGETMIWMRMPGQTWLDVGTSFLGMWTVMMAAMMLPSLIPMLMRYRRAVGGTAHLNALTALVGVGYFLVWMFLGAIVFPLGAALASIAMPLPRIMIGVLVLIAASVQFTEWKGRRLAWCRGTPEYERALTPDARSAWRYGLCLGAHCAESCAGLMAILLVVGLMDLRAMTAITVALTVERLAPNGLRAARAIGTVGVGAGLFLIALAIAV